MLLETLLVARLKLSGEAVEGVDAPPHALRPPMNSSSSSFARESFASLSAWMKAGSLAGGFAAPSLLEADAGRELGLKLRRLCAEVGRLCAEVGLDDAAWDAILDDVESSLDPNESTDILEGRRTIEFG